MGQRLFPAHEALLLAEQFRELARPKSEKSPVDSRAAAMERAFQEAGQLSTALHESLAHRATDRSDTAVKESDRRFNAVGKNCAACHARLRD